MDSDKFNAKFDFFVNKLENENPELIKITKELENRTNSRIDKLSNLIGQGLSNICKESFNRLFLYSIPSMEDDKGINIDKLKPLEGHEKDYEKAKLGFEKCKLEVESFPNMLIYNLQTMNQIILKSNELCLKQCKNEVKESKLDERLARQCINTCLAYKTFNLVSAYDVMNEEFDNKENFLKELLIEQDNIL
jgi:hypothetical protein